jgi:UDP-N-acetylglucosamine 2-epimerase (non-hydrolysing)
MRIDEAAWSSAAGTRSDTRVQRSLYLVAGARPNFMKIAPLVRALRRHGDGLRFKLVHTGQHYDREMNGVFFEELGIPAPDVCLECGGGSHAEQTAKIMLGFEQCCRRERPDCVLVVGDVNSTLACSIVAKKLGIPVVHVEAGLRSRDMAMPEEINRIVTDSISDLFFATEPAAVENLVREGKPKERVFHVGHVMVDNLIYQCERLAQTDTSAFESTALKSRLGCYGVVTLHRPSNVDTRAALERIAAMLAAVAQRIPLVFPLHPRTRSRFEEFGISLGARVLLTGPMPYMEFLNLWKDAKFVLTDSGGVQEETTALGVPCITVRDSTERPITVEEGTNVVTGTDPQKVKLEVFKILEGRTKRGRRPALWDGRAAERIVEVLARALA